MREMTIWLCYDFTIGGDRQGLYSWLDKHRAKECCDSAVIQYTFKEDFLAEIEQDVRKSVKLSDKDRLYIIWTDETGKTRGKFLNGGRMIPIWKNYWHTDPDIED